MTFLPGYYITHMDLLQIDNFVSLSLASSLNNQYCNHQRHYLEHPMCKWLHWATTTTLLSFFLTNFCSLLFFSNKFATVTNWRSAFRKSRASSRRPPQSRFWRTRRLRRRRRCSGLATPATRRRRWWRRRSKSRRRRIPTRSSSRTRIAAPSATDTRRTRSVTRAWRATIVTRSVPITAMGSRVFYRLPWDLLWSRFHCKTNWGLFLEIFIHRKSFSG